MPDGSVEILFKTTAELAGAKAAQEQLERTIGRKKALGEEYVKEAAQLTKVDTALASHAKAQKAVTEATDHGQESMKKLIETVPGLSAVMHAAATPIGAVSAAIGASIALIQTFDAKVSAAAESMFKLGEGSRGFDGIKQALAEVRNDVTKFVLDLNNQREGIERMLQPMRTAQLIAQAGFAQKGQSINLDRELGRAQLLAQARQEAWPLSRLRPELRKMEFGFKQADAANQLAGEESAMGATRSEIATLNLRQRDESRSVTSSAARLAAAKGSVSTGDMRQADILERRQDDLAALKAARQQVSDFATATMPMGGATSWWETAKAGGLGMRGKVMLPGGDKQVFTQETAPALLASIDKQVSELNLNIRQTLPAASTSRAGRLLGPQDQFTDATTRVKDLDMRLAQLVEALHLQTETYKLRRTGLGERISKEGMAAESLDYAVEVMELRDALKTITEAIKTGSRQLKTDIKEGDVSGQEATVRAMTLLYERQRESTRKLNELGAKVGETNQPP